HRVLRRFDGEHRRRPGTRTDRDACQVGTRRGRGPQGSGSVGDELVALMPVADALSAVLAGATALPAEFVALDAAHHRVLADDLKALRTQPPQAMSAMDGYAVRSADTSAVPARLKVIGEIAAGRPFDQP